MTNAYLELKVAWEMFGKAPEALADTDKVKSRQIAARQQVLEQRILNSPEASAVVIPETILAARLAEIQQRYADTDDFEQDIARQGLCTETLSAAITRDLRMEAVLEKVAATVPMATDTDAEIFYRLNPQAFDQPELRRLRHILITVDSEKDLHAATTLLHRLRHESRSVDAFAKAALRYSQCPTAMEGGVLGMVKQGQLYPELEPVAFGLHENEISEIAESPMGLHIIRCDEIFPGGMKTFDEVRERILEKLSDQRRAQAQRTWIKGLPA